MTTVKAVESLGEVKRLASMERIGGVVDQFYEDLRQAPSRGQKVAWCGGFPTTFPILRAHDVAYLFEDVYAATAAARHKEKKLQEITAKEGYLPEMCSYARTTLGVAYFPEAEKATADPYYLMPSPDFLIFVDVGCSMLANWSDAGRRHFGKPMFGIAVPFVWKMSDLPEAIAEVTRQFRQLPEFLEDHTGRKFDYGRLRDVMALTKQAVTLRMEAKELAARAVPSPTTFFDWASAVGAVTYAIGTRSPWTSSLTSGTRSGTASKQGITALPKEEVRAYWIGHMCWPYMRWWGETLAELGVNIVAANYTHLGFMHRPDLMDPDKPLESMAANSVCVLSYGVEPLAELIIDHCRR